MKLASALRLSQKIVSNTPKMALDRFIWMDLEMTGLDPEKDHILEIACLVTTPDLTMVNDGIDLVINQPHKILENMNEWCKVHHKQSGLIDRCKNSKISLAEAELQIFKYIESNVHEKGTNYIAGNSIYMDLLFIKKFLPSISNFFHYRLLDISSLKILCSNWYPEEFKTISKEVKHRALSDIHSSIDELKAYKELFMK